MTQLSTCLWFNDQAEEAARLYTSIFENSRLGRAARYGEAASKASGRPKGSLMTQEFELAGQKFLGLNGGPHFKFTPAISLFVTCKSENEIDSYWQNLSPGGKVLFELKKYPWAEKYGWCTDKFGVPWQFMIGETNQKIAPSILFMDKLLGRAKEALEFYTSKFQDSKIESVNIDPSTQSVMHSSFKLSGKMFTLMEGDKPEKHHINEAISFVVSCDNQKEIDDYTDELTAGGGSIGACGWVKDKFGVSWQIVPTILADMTTTTDTAKADNAMKALVQMKKLDLAKLKAAFGA